MKPIEVNRNIFRFENDAVEKKVDKVVTEFPVTVKVNGQEFVTMV
ncbi:MAG: sulfurtransferase FdhD, partial [Bacillales bacterium]|nr:sulfurtransferase FdhD [Bacillales bacterium]